jgi:ATP-binding cassette subfamily B protein/subfamily B ATP-binding cassette protein MsbA
VSRRPDPSRKRYDDFKAEVRGEKEPARKQHKPQTPAEFRKQRMEQYFDKKKLQRPFSEIFAAFWALMPGHKVVLGMALGTLAFSTLVGLVTPAAPKFVIDYVLTDSPGPSGIPPSLGLPTDRVTLLWWLAGALIIFEVLSLIISTFGRFQLLRLQKRLQNEMRRKVFQHAVRLPLWRIHALKSGGVASVLRADASAPSDIVVHLFYTPFRSLIQLLGSFVVLAFVDWLLLVGAMLLLPLIVLSHRTYIAKIRPLYRGARTTREDVDAHATEAFGGMRVVRTFSQERVEGLRFVSGVHLMARQEILAWWWSRALEILWRIALPGASIVVIVYGGIRVLEGTLTLGDVMLFITYTMMLLGPLEALVSTAVAIQNSLSGYERVLDLMDERREFADQEIKKRVDRGSVKGHVEIKDLKFAYPGTEKAVLDGVSLDVQPGQTVAFVGPSGAGKTTLSNLIARFYDPDGGSVEIDGTDLREIDVMTYRDLLGIVEQDVFLFDGTIRDNIAYARRDATMDDVENAAKLAHAHEFILETEDGYDTIIGERGVRLSGGQKQRIALARAILADPALLILDEATSNLDSESEALIQQSLSELMKGRTSFVIAHRLSTVRDADQIVVLEDGKVIEHGTHEELLDRDGRYATFLAGQLERAHRKAHEDAQSERDVPAAE